MVLLKMVSTPKNIDNLKQSIKTLWQMENELRYSAWSALTLDKEKVQAHLSEARRHLNVMLNEVDPVDHVADQPPAMDPKK